MGGAGYGNSLSPRGIGSPRAIALEDKIREASRQAVRGLHGLGIKVAMITGDARRVAQAVSKELGIDEFFAEVMPQQKDATVADLQKRGHVVAMVGGGVNDLRHSHAPMWALRSAPTPTLQSSPRE